MRISLGKIVVLAGFLPGLVWARHLREGWDIILTQSQFERGQETFSLVSLRPTNVKKMLEATPPEKREDLLWRLYSDRQDANQILYYIKDFIYDQSVSRGMVVGEQREKLKAHLEKILTGKYPFSVVTRYGDPYDIYHLFGMGLDFGEGLPLETRLVGRGMQRLPRPKKQITPVPVCYVPPTGKPSCNQEISDFLSLIPRAHGDIAELRSLTKSPDSPYDFTELLYYRAISEGWMYWGGTELAASDRAPALSSDMLARALDLKSRFPTIPDELLFPEKQEFLFIDDFYAHTLTNSRERLYLQKLGLERFLPLFGDPDFLPNHAHILHITSSDLKDVTSDLLASIPAHELLSNGVMAHNYLPPLACSVLIGDLSEIPSYRHESFPTFMRLISAEEKTVPPESYIRQEMQRLKMFPPHFVF